MPGFLPALVIAPPARERRYPLFVVTHGAGGAPEHHCAYWFELVRTRAFILCPRGREISKLEDQGYYYENHLELEKEVLSALDALSQAFGDRVDTESAVYAGYSQGATMGALMIVGHADRFPKLVLIEGGYKQWNLAIARRYEKAGGQRVLFACGVSSCSRHARRSVASLKQAGVEAELADAPGAGHTYYGAVADRVSERFEWVVGDDPRWR